MVLNKKALASLLLIVIALDGHFANRAPLINATDEVEIASGISWLVKCTSNYPIIWKAHDAYFDWTPPSIKSSSFFSHLEMQYVSILTIGSTSAATVGRYYCVESEKKNEHLDVMVAEEFASSVYLFVNDSTQPLVPTYEKLYYTPNEELIIPCKPSFPDTEVELCNKDGSDCLMVYDKTKGVTISKTSSIIKDGILYCKSDNANYTINVLPPDDMHDHDNLARLDERITHTCCILIGLGEKVMIKMNAEGSLTSENYNDRIKSETPNSEMRFPIAVVLKSGNNHTTLQTQKCNIINLQLNVTLLSDIVCVKNGALVQLKKDPSYICGSQTILSFEERLRQDDEVLGEYQFSLKKLGETSDSSAIVFPSSILLIGLVFFNYRFLQ